MGYQARPRYEARVQREKVLRERRSSFAAARPRRLDWDRRLLLQPLQDMHNEPVKTRG